MNLLRILLRLFLSTARLGIVEGEGGGGPALDVGQGGEAPSADVGAGAAPAANAEPAAPTTMLEAISQGMARDELGRFKGKEGAPADPAAPGQPAAVQAEPSAPAAPVKPDAPEDLTVMPEGLGAKAQERFQKLANGIKERDDQLQQAQQQLSYVRETFQNNGITQEQFEQAASVVGAINRGDFKAAQQILTEQLRQLSLMTGETLPGVDALAEFPDLRQKVDSLLIDEATALETARYRKQQSALQQRQQAQQQSQQAEQAHGQAVQSAQIEVDRFCKRMAATDLDYSAIEKLLLPRIPKLLQGVPPSQWPALVQTQYELIKESGLAFRQPAAAAAPAAAPLRPMGAGSGQPKPTSLEEAMWGRRLSA
jgi:hypothetical protein